MIQILQKLALLCTKTAIFKAKFFDENIFKIITSVPVFEIHLSAQLNNFHPVD
jgi:hypothetical protein